MSSQYDLAVGEDAVKRSHLLMRVICLNCILVHGVAHLLLPTDDCRDVSDDDQVAILFIGIRNLNYNLPKLNLKVLDACHCIFTI